MPTDFVSYIANAEYVITNSFHGTAFAIIFNKELTVFKNANKNHDNSRLEILCLLRELKIDCLKRGNDFFDNRIDYEMSMGTWNSKLTSQKSIWSKLLITLEKEK